MGTVVPKSYPEIGYRWATEVEDEAFVGTGPPLAASVDRLREFLRRGMVTDDSCQALAVAESIVECVGVDGAHVAQKCAENLTASDRGEPVRGFPPTAKRVMVAILKGEDYRKTGTSPYFPFPGGSFANGGAMRISPLAIAYRHASAEVLRDAVTEACMSTHVHEEAVDGAVVQASAVAYCLEAGLSEGSSEGPGGVAGFDPLAMLHQLIEVTVRRNQNGT
mmetsp:Transcript_75542/g.214882  ORF Transcript_75542/g.214882 Transcript_75542/m.214882 type:complete len:221 (+) Transcript_75542:284-946(+)